MKTKAMQQDSVLRYDWTTLDVAQLFQLPFLELVYQAASLHRQFFPESSVQVSTLLNIKTGACPEDCQYCPQSGHYNTGLKKEPLMSIERVKKHARAAKANGATRFCMGAAWKKPPEKEFETILQMIKVVQEEGLETCVTLGSLTKKKALALKEQGLDYYNHNLDTSQQYYEKIITTRTYQERLETLQHIRNSGIKTCCGGIVGMGETLDDRIELLCQLARFNPHPESVPINKLVPVPGTPLAKTPPLDSFDFVRVIAVARIMMPNTKIRLSAGREGMSHELQALCFLAGANSVFYGEKLLTTKNPSIEQDKILFEKLGISISC